MGVVMTKRTNRFARFAAGAALMLCAATTQALPIAAPGTEGLKVIVNGSGHVFATYQGNTAAYSNDLMLDGNLIFNNHATPVGTTVDLGFFTAGTELVFQLYVHNTGWTYSTGAASGNPDGHAHARVQADWQPGETLVSFEDLFNGAFDFNDLSFSFTNTTSGPISVPEPKPLALMLVGFGLVGLMVRRRRV